MKNTRGSEWNKWDLHIHTASSYDSPYKADDADELLCQALAENDIKAVAITDHFKIDKTRIEHLRKLAPEIVFFPGVELRTDKGANNLHLILIFSELSDLETLSADFNAIMLRTLAKSKESDETIYWQFDDIVEFCKNHGGLISIHAGKKSNGIDKEISNALPVKEAIKSDIAKHVDFFEVGKKKDIVDYYKYVFKEIDEKPIILCSDCHDPRKYSAKESLWIKANVTFEGLKQCIFQPSERVYVGTIPAAVDSLKKYQEILERHEKNKPQEIKKPDEKEENIQYQEKLKEIDKEITELNQKVEQNRDELTKINEAIGETEQIIAKLRVLRSEFGDIKEELNVYLKKYQLEIKEDFCLKDPLEIIEQYKNKLITDKTIKQLTLNGSPMEKGLLNELKIAHDKKNDLISTSDIEEKKYQKYLNDLQDWEKEKQKIIGSQDTEDCLTYYKSEKEYLDNILETDYHRAREERNIKFKELFVLKQRIVIIYQEIYAPIEQEIKKLLGDLEETIEFQAEMQLMDNDFSNKILSSISQRFAGVFKGKTEANNRITRLLRSTEFSDENSVLDLVNSIILAVDEDIDNSEKKITDKKEFYDYLYGLEYVGVSFKLKMGGRDLEELSPGERGIVLLIFYLALSQNSIPIIIDQPEDNLDNQSVYNKLVPCICAAKQKRQVIIVTHNPNIAVACDAEQIICCKMDKNTHKITYLSGAIEDQEIKQNVVDILEGTMPAFDLRRRKYV